MHEELGWDDEGGLEEKVNVSDSALGILISSGENV